MRFASSVCCLRVISALLLPGFLGSASVLLLAPVVLAESVPPRTTDERLAPLDSKAFRDRGVSSIRCIAACNEFFEAGQADFELEIQRLQERAVRENDQDLLERNLLEIDRSLIEDLEKPAQ